MKDARRGGRMCVARGKDARRGGRMISGEGERRPLRRAYVCGEGGFYTEGVASAASISRLMSK